MTHGQNNKDTNWLGTQERGIMAGKASVGTVGGFIKVAINRPGFYFPRTVAFHVSLGLSSRTHHNSRTVAHFKIQDSFDVNDPNVPIPI